MGLVLDTDTLPPRDRAGAVQDAFGSTLLPTAVSTPAAPRCRLSAWHLGPGVDLLEHESNGLRLTRRTRHVRQATAARMSLHLTVAGEVRLQHLDINAPGAVGELRLVDSTAPYDFRLRGPGRTLAVFIDYRQLGLPVETVRAAAPLLTTSPLCDLVREHLLALPRAAEDLGSGRARELLASSTVDLARALVSSAAPAARGLPGSTLFHELVAYVREHQRETDLGAARLAAAHGRSVRAVYAAFAGEGVRLSDLVMRGRLEGARGELAVHGSATVAAIAEGWGFPDARHFARRFRQEYGLSPSQWQQLNTRTAQQSQDSRRGGPR